MNTNQFRNLKPGEILKYRVGYSAITLALCVKKYQNTWEVVDHGSGININDNALVTFLDHMNLHWFGIVLCEGCTCLATREQLFKINYNYYTTHNRLAHK